MKIDYKKELEQASKGMIMIHDPKLLIKLIVRMIVRKLCIKHAAMILYEPDKNCYVLNISRGETGIKIPAGFTRFNRESPIIKIFLEKEFRSLTIDKNAIVASDINRMIWRESVLENGNGNGIKELLHKVDEQMQMLNTVACVPAFYQDKLMAVLLLGEKYDLKKYEQPELDFFAALASDAAMAIRNAQLFEGLKKEADRNKKLFYQTIIVLSSAIEAKDAYTHGHTERVTKFSLMIAQQMVNNGSVRFHDTFFDHLYIGSLLHDVGKIGIPEAILHKKEKLTKSDYEVIKEHPIRGAEMIKPLSLSKECIDGVRYHHEKFDGTGYPKGLSKNEIPISASIISVADAYDAMTTDRPYRKALKKKVAVKEIENQSGKQFNPVVVKALMELVKKGMI